MTFLIFHSPCNTRHRTAPMCIISYCVAYHTVCNILNCVAYYIVWHIIQCVLYHTYHAFLCMQSTHLTTCSVQGRQVNAWSHLITTHDYMFIIFYKKVVFMKGATPFNLPTVQEVNVLSNCSVIIFYVLYCAIIT